MNTHTRTHTYISQITQSMFERAKINRVGDRKKVSLQQRSEGRQSLSMSLKAAENIYDTDRMSLSSFKGTT